MPFSLMSNFNSIKVQLEPRCQKEKGFVNPFQFHKGTIRTSNPNKSQKSRNHFNSIKVQLEQVSVAVSIYKVIDFNSIKVQLEQHIV